MILFDLKFLSFLHLTFISDFPYSLQANNRLALFTRGRNPALPALLMQIATYTKEEDRKAE